MGYYKMVISLRFLTTYNYSQETYSLIVISSYSKCFGSRGEKATIREVGTLIR